MIREVERVTPPDWLLTCPSEPVAVAADASAEDRAAAVALALDAGRACRDQLGAVRDWVRTE